MLAASVETFTLPPRWFAAPKFDGFRAIAARRVDGPPILRSRSGSDLSAAFPEISDAIRQLPYSVVHDGELIIWDENRLAFEWLTQRLHRRGAAARQAGIRAPAHYVTFDLLHVDGSSLLARPYTERRLALETLLRREDLVAPWTLCPSTDDIEVARSWLTWSVVGVEGYVFKDGGQNYRPGARSWRKYRVRDTQEFVAGAVTGPPAAHGLYCSAGTTPRTACNTRGARHPCPPRRPGTPGPSCVRRRTSTPGPGTRSPPAGGRGTSGT
ncbi:hypothetical protein [Streptomyces sp. A5-4]|uniref:ATP-dependent DNA ligase n=1 Tax=Streptomyces sp. A5-4 TaxID=3384771 RepID=UPI003DA8CD86